MAESPSLPSLVLYYYSLYFIITKVMKLNKIANILSIIHHFIWIIIGLVILVLGTFFIVTGYKSYQTLQSSGSISQAQSGIKTPLPQLTQKELNCIKDSLGQKRFDEIAGGSASTPSPEEQAKLEKCFP
jgi:hypothetical protein